MTWRAALIAAALAVPFGAHAQGLDAARQFTLQLYAAYQHGEPDYLGRDARLTFAPQLLALIRRDQATTPSGDVGILDGDPICDCQDAQGVRLAHLTIRQAGPARAHAKVTLSFPTETRSMELVLVAEGARWRVADVHTRETSSLAKLLRDGLGRRSAGVR